MPKYEGTLFDLIQKGHKFNESDIHRIALQTLSGLKELADQKLVHRDIKASNIFLGESHEGPDKHFFLLGDMEAANFLQDGISHVSGATGTFAHLSPE